MTNTSKHTPGPWVAIHEPGRSSDTMTDNGGYRIDAPDDSVTQLAFVWVLNHRMPADGSPQEGGPLFGDVRAGANARLIAAAPEMLDALRTVGSALAERKITQKDDELWAAFSQVVAAIAKAEGHP